MSPPTALATAPGPFNSLDKPIDALTNLNIRSSTKGSSNFPTLTGRFNPRSAKAPIDSRDVTKLAIERGFDPDSYEHEHLLPSFPDLKWDSLEEQDDYVDVALRADPTYQNLWNYVNEVEHLTPKFGTVLYGIDLSQLNEKAKDELARLIAFRGVVFARGQQNFDIKSQLALGTHWGNLHRHATTGIPRGASEDPDLLDVHVVYAASTRVPTLAYTQTNMWHSDVSYEKQPPSYTSLKLLEGPEHGGGDTLWSNGYGLYDSLSPALQQYLSKLTALHSAVEQADGARKSGNAVRREPVVSEHPIVRTNEVTGYNSVYVNPGFTRRISGVPKSESDAILQLLFTEIATNVTNSVRWKWQEGDVALWDNRSTTHAASYGFYPHTRHAVRVTTTAETPKFEESGMSQQESIDKELGINSIHKDAARPPVYND